VTNYFAIVNPRSGSRAGTKLLGWLADQSVPAASIFDKEKLSTLVRQIKKTAGDRRHKVIVIAAGGDGTASSVIQLMQQSGIKAPVVPFPLGTGNELAYNLGWGDYYKKMGRDALLKAYDTAAESKIDFWRARVKHVGNAEREYHFQSFFSLGMDARVVHSHATLQGKFPMLYRFRFMSLIWYVVFGVYEAFLRRIRMGKYLTMTEGKQSISAPRAGIIHILNIPTSGGHTDYFGESGFAKKPDQHTYFKPSISDGFLEISATEGIRSFLKSVLKLGPVKRLAQVKTIDITVDPKFPQRIQIDGEKIDDLALAVSIRRAGQQRILLGPGVRKGC
jgi:diacylglycerol kinase family enzyme